MTVIIALPVVNIADASTAPPVTVDPGGVMYNPGGSFPPPASASAPSASSQDVPPGMSLVPSGVRIFNPNKIPCKRTDVPQDVIGAQTVVSQQGRTPTNPAHNHEAHAPASSSSGVNRSPAFMNPANPGSAPMARQGMVETQKNYGQHNQDIDDAAKAMESVFGDPSKAKGNPSQNSGNHEARRKGGSSGNGNSGSSAGNNGSSAASHEAHGGAGDTKK